MLQTDVPLLERRTVERSSSEKDIGASKVVGVRPSGHQVTEGQSTRGVFMTLVLIFVLTAAVIVLPILMSIFSTAHLSTSPLAGAVKTPTYRYSLIVGITQVSVQFWFNFLLDRPLDYRLLFTVLFFGLNIYATFFVTEESVVAATYLALWCCSKAGGLFASFHLLVNITPGEEEGKREATPYLATTGFVFCCLSLTCGMYSSYFWQELLSKIRICALPVWAAILLYMSHRALDGFRSIFYTSIDVFQMLSLFSNVIFIAIYFFISPGGVTIDSEAEELIKINCMIIAYFLIDSLQIFLLRQKEATDLRQAALLREVFPAHVLSSLLRHGTATPKVHMNCSVFFSDIVSFVELAEELGPVDTLKMLHKLFCEIDDCAAECGIYKVET